MKQDKKTIKTYFEKGDVPTEEQFAHLIDSYIDSKQETGKPNRRFVIDENGEVTVTEEQRLPEYSLTKISNTKIGLVKNNNIIQEIDLSNYIDDTNLARLVSGTLDTNGIATFKRDDDSTFTVDFSNLLATSLSIDSLSDAQSNFNSILIGTRENPDSEGETRGINNIVIGKDAILDGVGDDNVLIGKSVLGGLGNNGNNSSNNNVVIGSRAAEDRVNFNDNVIIGGNSVTTDGSGSRNIIIGPNIEIGGHNISDQLNIGNTIKGDLSTKTIEIEKLKLTKLDEGNSETDQYITIDSSGVIRKVDQQNTNSSNQLQVDWNQTDDTQPDFVKNKPKNEISIINPDGSIAFKTTEKLQFDKYHSINSINKTIGLNEDYFRTIAIKNNSAFTIVSNHQNISYTEEKEITLGTIFSDKPIHIMDFYLVNRARNGGSQEGTLLPNKVTHEVLLEPLNAKFNNNVFELILFKIEMTENSDISNTNDSKFSTKKIDFLTNRLASLNYFTKLSYEEKTYDIEGNTLKSVSKSYNTQSLDHTTGDGVANMELKDVKFKLKMRVTVDFLDSTNSNNNNQKYGTLMTYQGLINEKI